MKKQKLIFAVLALLVGGANSASAYTTSDLTSAGWTQVTDLSSMNLSDYYFAIVSNDNTDLMVKMDKAKSDQQKSNHSMWYMNGKDPIKDNSYLWTLEANNTSGYVGYTIRNVDRPVRVLQTNEGKSWFCRTNWETTSARWTSYEFEVAEGIYSIKTLANGGTNYLGLWTPTNGYVSGQELAGNKSGNEIGKFKIYSILKTTANSRIAAAADATSDSPSDLAPSLWGRKTSDYSSDVNLGYYGDYLYIERYRDDVAPQTGDIITKTITNAPNGIHEISVIVNAAWIYNRGKVGTTVPTVNDNSTVVTINGVSQNVPVRTDGSYNPVTLNFKTRVTDGKIDFAIHNNDAAAFWFVWDITDIFHNTCLSDDAIDLPANGEMAAGQWYKYVVANTGEYTVSATNAGDIIVSEDALVSEYTGTAIETGASVNLTAGTYYYKSTSNNTLTITINDPIQPQRDVIVANKGDLSSLINGTFQDNADGWDGGSRVTTVKDRGWRGGNATIFYERTTAGTMSYTLSNMPAGTYKVVAAWRSINGGTMTPSIAGTNGSTVTGTGDAAPAVGTKEINMNGVEMPYSNLGGFTTNNLGHNWHWITATGTLAEDGNLVINFTTAGTAGWNAIDDVHLYCTSLGGTSYTTTVTEGSAVSNSDGKVVTCDIILSNPNSIVSSDEIITTAAGAHMYNNLVSGKIEQMMLYDGYTFSMSAGDYTINNSYGAAKFYRQFTKDQYCTVCLPFTPAIGTGTYYEPVSFVDGVLTLSAVADKDLKPNTPYILKPAGSYSELWNNNNGVNSEKYNVKYTGVRPATSISDDAMWFTGTYEKIDNIGSWSGTYYVLGTDNNLHKVAGEVSVNPFRAYFFISGESGARSTIRVNFDGTTGVENVEAVSEAAQKEGKFFKDGKLFIFKNGKKYNANGVQVK